EKAQHAPLAAFAFVVVTRAFREFAALVLVLELVLILASGFGALLEKAGEKHVADSTAAQNSAADYETQEFAMITALITLVGVVVDFLVFIFELIGGTTLLAHEVCEQQAADAGAAQEAACDQEFQQAMLLVAAFLVVRATNLFIAYLVATTLAKQACKKQA